jgi:hypothetical protein
MGKRQAWTKGLGWVDSALILENLRRVLIDTVLDLV